MRIVIDARYLTRKFSGIRMYSERLLEHLALQDKENEYFCFVRSDYTRPLALGENFHLLRYPSPPLSLRTIFSLHRVISRIQPDFFHTLFPLMPIFYKGKLLVNVYDLQPLLMKEWTGRRFLPLKKMYDLFYRWIYPYTFKRADWIIAISQATKDALTDLFPHLAEKTLVIHAGIDPEVGELQNSNVFENLVKKHNIPTRYILYVGSTRPNKNIPTMLKAFALLAKRHQDTLDVAFVLVLTPDRFLADIKHVINELHLSSKVIILDPVSQTEKHALYTNAQMLFFATRLEGFGFPLLEAQAYGAPVVASRDYSLPEIAGDSALLVDPFDTSALAEAMFRALSDQALRKELIQKGKENITNFSWQRTAKMVLEVYHHLI